ncbi:Alpha-amylase/alpha-mannosidase, GH57 family [Balnearium lithotrophicum]|uniref:Alpha-amylase/alpha-mannosidase, GH57 family n=1 Tax=Balnearium lithotrophicum TaxID=223788 RepID=A0A521BNS3_9BACT|nr:glycoside hydrolase family 57 protein [Balnearium lithotrophicum]SMO48782.1 Alpha-amylase/alpha-mannosidase, GH57 family [Balnearium lithotrophicum]
MKLIFLWHMHQPVYRNGLTGEYELPYVFLHSIKDYYDMPYHVSRFKNVKVAFNLTPSLVSQIEEYASGRANCKFLRLMKKSVKELTLSEKDYLIKVIFSSSPKLFEEFELLNKLYFAYQSDRRELCRNLSNQDFLNLEVLFLLSWCGNYLKRENETVRKLREEISAYTEEDKTRLIEELLNHVGKIVPLYRELTSLGQIEVTTSPFYHPVLPLLIDMKVARESTPDVKLPAVQTPFKDDAVKQVERALSFHRKRFGEVGGVWLPEGGISEEAVSLLSNFGVEWTASDEEILFNSLQEKTGTREPLYRVYKFKRVKVLFRDKELSDLIGFTYKNWKSDDAAKDFIERLKDINRKYENPVVSVILDGENCWEFYENNGFEFREKLYREISESKWIETVKPSEVEHTEVLNRIFPGSWIGGNFLTWVGDDEKNRAWELLSLTKLQFKRGEPKSESAEEYILISEGSDWFWWFGRGHYTPFSLQFDRLFRSNLIEVYRILGKDIPDELLHPIKTSKELPSTPPKGYLHVELDGEVSNYFEWLNAGEIDLLELSTMDSSSFVMRKAYYGCDEEKNLFIRVDGNWERVKGGNLKLTVEFSGEGKEEVEFNLSENPSKGKNCSEARAVLGKLVEILIPNKCLPEAVNGKLKLILKLYMNGKLLETAPQFTPAVLDVGKDFNLDWIV